MRILFIASPDFAVPILHTLHIHHDVIGVVTQPDKPAGRGRKLRSCPVCQAALKLGLPVIQPTNINTTEDVNHFRFLHPDLIAVAAYGQILRQPILDLPKYGCINLHPSLLPRWRGATPIQAAIIHGDKKTGITIMLMDAGLDTGPILSQQATSILPHETGGQLSTRLANIGKDLLIPTIEAYTSGKRIPTSQDDEMATYAPMLKKSDGQLDFSRPASYLERQVRAYEPWPASFLLWNERRLIIRKAHADDQSEINPGEVIQVAALPAIGTSSGILLLDVVQPSGRVAMSGASFIRGAPDFLGCKLPTL
jgi:methionyl-tRNA formyltransferase